MTLNIFLLINITLGFTAITGVGEASFLKGRAAILFLLNTGVIISLLLDEFLSKKIFVRLDNKSYIVILALTINILLNIFFIQRQVNNSNHAALNSLNHIIDQNYKHQISVYSNISYLNTLDKRIIQIDEIIGFPDYIVLDLKVGDYPQSKQYFSQDQLNNLEENLRLRSEENKRLNNLYKEIIEDYTKKYSYKMRLFLQDDFIILSSQN